MGLLGGLLVAAQCVLALRVVARLLRTANGSAIEPSPVASTALVSIVVPVLEEEDRLAACLDGLVAQGPQVCEIIVVDGGSSDRTREIAHTYAARDDRVRVLEAPPTPSDWNGKAWNLDCGTSSSRADASWLLFVDADVRVRADLVTSLVAHAARSRTRAFSVATRQRVADPIDGALHPAMLTTLVYRFGIPGTATRELRSVQANGQCFCAERALLVAEDVIRAARDSRCEDVTMARALVRQGVAVGFYESRELVDVAMYASWRETVAGWPRSLPLSDRYLSAWLGLAEIWLVQALPLVVLMLTRRARSTGATSLAGMQRALLLLRIATLLGTRRAYCRPPWTYWLSPWCDLPVAVLLTASAMRRTHRWRGRRLLIEHQP